MIFALDSIPAIFAVTQDPFLVYTSNIFAILGLRSLYFVFAGALSKFYYLRTGLAVVLSFVGVKMVLAGIYAIPTLLSLAVIALVLASVLPSAWLTPLHQLSPRRLDLSLGHSEHTTDSPGHSDGPQCLLKAGACDRTAPLRDSHRLCHRSRSSCGVGGSRVKRRL